MRIIRNFTNFYLPLSDEDLRFVKGPPKMLSKIEEEHFDDEKNQQIYLVYSLYDLNKQSSE